MSHLIAARALRKHGINGSCLRKPFRERPQDEVNNFLCQGFLWWGYNTPANQISHSFIWAQYFLNRDKRRHGNAAVGDDNTLSPLNVSDERAKLGLRNGNRSITHLTIIVRSYKTGKRTGHPLPPHLVITPALHATRTRHHPPRLAQKDILRTAHRPIARRALRVSPVSRQVPCVTIIAQAHGQ